MAGAVTIDRLARTARTMSIDPNDTYIISYPELVTHFANVERFGQHEVIIGASIVYAWMPKVLQWKNGDFGSVAQLLNRVKEGDRLRPSEMSGIASLVNNSVVGASKLLHFVNPRIYPMWDRWVWSYWARKWPRNYRNDKMNNVDNYLAYLIDCDDLVQDRRFPQLHRLVERGLPYGVSPFRAVEQIMFHGGREGPHAEVN